jgi:hypothetical protein
MNDFNLDKFKENNDKYNYLEIYFNNTELKNNNEIKKFNLNLTEDKFKYILNKFIEETQLKPFQKKFIIYYNQDKELHYLKNEKKFNVFQKNLINLEILKNNSNNIFIKYDKKDLPIINFELTNKINNFTNTIILNKLIFKLNNRIYINFEISIYKHNNSKFLYKIYFNFNNSTKKSIDYDSNFKIIKKYINIINNIFYNTF